jgi:hypothetical protein
LPPIAGRNPRTKGFTLGLRPRLVICTVVVDILEF